MSEILDLNDILGENILRGLPECSYTCFFCRRTFSAAGKTGQNQNIISGTYKARKVSCDSAFSIPKIEATTAAAKSAFRCGDTPLNICLLRTAKVVIEEESKKK